MATTWQAEMDRAEAFYVATLAALRRARRTLARLDAKAEWTDADRRAYADAQQALRGMGVRVFSVAGLQASFRVPVAD